MNKIGVVTIDANPLVNNPNMITKEIDLYCSENRAKGTSEVMEFSFVRINPLNLIPLE